MGKGKEFWSGHLAAIDAQGITTKAYAEREGLARSALFYWRKRLKAEASAAKPRVASGPLARLFVPVHVSEAEPSVRCCLMLAPGVRLELAQLPPPEWLAALGAAILREAR